MRNIAIEKNIKYVITYVDDFNELGVDMFISYDDLLKRLDENDNFYRTYSGEKLLNYKIIKLK